MRSKPGRFYSNNTPHLATIATSQIFLNQGFNLIIFTPNILTLGEVGNRISPIFFPPSFIEVWLTSNIVYIQAAQCDFLRCIKWWFNICIHSELITTVKLLNISTITHNYIFCFLVVRTLRISSLTNPCQNSKDIFHKNRKKS